MTILSVAEAIAHAEKVRETTIFEYTNSLIAHIGNRVIEVANEGILTGDIYIEQSVNDWCCKPAGWCAIEFTAPSVELFERVIDQVSAHLVKLGYEVTTFNNCGNGDQRGTVIHW